MKRNPWLTIILSAYVLLAVFYSIVVPLGESPDESEHFLYLQHIALTGQLPVMQPRYADNVTLEAHQPPGLYLLGAALTGWIEQSPADNLEPNSCFSFEPDDDGRQNAYFHRSAEWPPQRGVYQVFQFMRWLDILFGLGTVYIAYLLGRRVMPGDNHVALWAAALLAFNPQWIHITASFNNDTPTTFLGAAITYLCIQVATKSRYRDTAVLGGLLGLGFLTKFALLAFWPLAFLAVGVHGYKATSQPAVANQQPSLAHHARFFIPHLLLVTLLPLLMAGWWYARNFQLYGDPMMWAVTLAAKGTVIARELPLTPADIGEFLVTHFQSYWLWFGWLTIKAPLWLYGLMAVMVGTAVVGLLSLLWRRHLPVNWLAICFCALGTAAIYASLLQYIQTINWTGYQGRLAFAAAAPIAVLLALGFYSLNQRWIGTAVAVGLFSLSLFAIPLLLLPAFPRPQLYQPSPDLTRICLRFADGLQVEALDLPHTTKPGEWLPVTVSGFGLRDTATPQTLGVRLRTWRGDIVGEAATSLTWAQGQVLSTTLSLFITDTIPTQAQLEIGLLTPSGQWLPATSATGRMLDSPAAVAAIKIAPSQPFLPEPEVKTAVTFGDQLSLIGYTYDPLSQKLTLYWQALTPMQTAYTTFIHILDENQQLVAQADGQPQDGAYPTTVWEPGEIVADNKHILLPTVTGAARLQIAIGVYTLATGERLPAFAAPNSPLPDNQFILPLRTP